MNKRERILEEARQGKRQVDLARKYEVSDAYISQVIRQEELEQKAKNFEFLKQLIEREAIEIKTSKMSNEEIKRLEEM